MDGSDTLHLPGLLPDPPLWHHVLRLSGPLLLDQGHHGLQQRDPHGAWDFPHCHLWTHHAGMM